MGNQNKTPLLYENYAQDTGSDLAGGFLHGMLGLVGAGSAYDPLGKLKSSLAGATNALQQAQNVGAYKTFIAIEDYQKYKEELDGATGKIMQEQMQYFNNLAIDKIEDVNVFLILLSVLVIIIIFFLLIR